MNILWDSLFTNRYGESINKYKKVFVTYQKCFSLKYLKETLKLCHTINQYLLKKLIY